MGTLSYFLRAASVNPGAAGAANVVYYRGNSIWDPDVAIGGHSAGGFAQLMALYGRYTVLKARATIHMWNTDTTNPAIVGIFRSSDVDGPTDVRQLIENGDNTWTMLTPAGLDHSYTKLTLDIDIPSYLSVSQPLDDEELSGDSGSDPTKECYWGIFAATPAGGDGNIVRFVAQFDYMTVFSEPVQVAIS